MTRSRRRVNANPGLDIFRDSVAELVDDKGEVVAHLWADVVRPRQLLFRWRKGPEEALWHWQGVSDPTEWDDSVGNEDQMDHIRRGRFEPYEGAWWTVRWLPTDDAEAVKRRTPQHLDQLDLD